MSRLGLECESTFNIYVNIVSDPIMHSNGF
jgi:hypothetical protein